MSYSYETQRPWVFTEEGVKKLLWTRSTAQLHLAESGAVRAGRLLGSGDSWNSMAVVDYLVEIGELMRVYDGRAWQDGVYVEGPNG